jgi:hypothetical protein
VTLAECCALAPDGVVGARVELTAAGASPVDVLGDLFGEGPSRVVVSVSPEGAAGVLQQAAAGGVPAARIGTTGGDVLSIAAAPLGSLSVGVRELRARADACLAPIVGE